MRAQRPRTDALPLTWELPASIAMTWLLLALVALPLGQGMACWMAGHGFAWPQGSLVGSVAGLVNGEPGVGLAAGRAEALPSQAFVYGMIGVVELLVLVVAGWTFTLWSRSLGPGAQFGMASRHEVAAVLGPGHLRRRRSIIRPDLHRRSGIRPVKGQGRAGPRQD